MSEPIDLLELEETRPAVRFVWWRLLMCRFGDHVLYWEEDAPEGGRQRHCAWCGRWFQVKT